MALVDGILFALLAAVLVFWWVPALPSRQLILFLCAGGLIAFGLYGALNDRWQAGICAGFGLLLITLTTLMVLRGGLPKSLPYISGPIITLFAALPAFALYSFPIGNIPAPSGPYSVGMRTFELSDETRPGLFGVEANAPRRLLVRVWYPAQVPTGAKPAPYFSAAEAKTTARAFGEFMKFPPLMTYLKHVKTNAYPNAPLANGITQLPPILFSHGALSRLNQSTFLMEDLASHGYGVYSVQHVGESAHTVFPNGDVIAIDQGLLEFAKTSKEAKGDYKDAIIKGMGAEALDDRLAGQLDWLSRRKRDDSRIHSGQYVWLEDRIFVLDQLEAGHVPAEIADIAAKSDFAQSGHMGMSFGGAIAGMHCAADPRCVAGINIDGALVQRPVMDKAVNGAFMVFTSDHDLFYKSMMGKGNYAPDLKQRHWVFDFSYERFGSAGERADIHRIELNRTAHMGLTDYPLFLRGPIAQAMLGKAPADIILGAQKDFIRSFFNTYMRGEDSGFPAAQLAEYADYTESRKAQHIRAWWLSKSSNEQGDIRRAIAGDETSGSLNQQ
ncbi:MAG: hypothetical protein AAF607_01340 [Pseudomonadota bacterium]